MYKFIFLLIFFLYGCSSFNTEPKFKISVFEDPAPKILLMPVDIEICELTVAGLCEPNALWTENSKKNVIIGFNKIIELRNGSVVNFDNSSKKEVINQLIKLHTHVGYEIINNEYGQLKMPTKEKFDWSIGKKVSILKKEYKSDYALFMFIRDQYSSTERMIYNVVTALLFPGVIPLGGTQTAFASLVDLKNGDIIWFNGYYRSFGDIRDVDSAIQTLDKLFEQFPG